MAWVSGVLAHRYMNGLHKQSPFALAVERILHVYVPYLVFGIKLSFMFM